MARVIKLSAASGGSLGSQIEFSKKATAMFVATDRNKILKAAMQGAAERWIAVYLPKRFNTAYMKRSPFNYHISRLSLKQKLRKAVFQGQHRERGQRYDFTSLRPLIMSGVMHDTALKRSRAVTRAPKGRVKAVIKIPTGHAIKTETQDMVRRMPTRELDAIGNDFIRNVVRIVNASTKKLTASGRVAKRGGVEQRSISGVRAQNTIRALQVRF